MKNFNPKNIQRSLLISSCAFVVIATGMSATAAPTYSIDKVLVAEDQYFGQPGVAPAQLYKPHEVVVSHSPNPNKRIWISSNERSGFAGITIFGGDNSVRAFMNIEEPGPALQTPRGRGFPQP